MIQFFLIKKCFFKLEIVIKNYVGYPFVPRFECFAMHWQMLPVWLSILWNVSKVQSDV